jgi:hypothetical protein
MAALITETLNDDFDPTEVLPAEPPSATELAVEVDPARPAQGLLIRLNAWRAQKRRDIDSGLRARSLLDAEATALAERQRASQTRVGDASRALAAAARAGAPIAVTGDLGAEDTGALQLQAEAVAGAIAEIDGDLETLHAEAMEIERRIADQCRERLVEVMAPAVARYQQAIIELAAATSELTAGNMAIGGFGLPAKKAELPAFPQFGLPKPELPIRRWDVGQRAAHYRGLLVAWGADPLATEPVLRTYEADEDSDSDPEIETPFTRLGRDLADVGRDIAAYADQRIASGAREWDARLEGLQAAVASDESGGYRLSSTDIAALVTVLLEHWGAEAIDDADHAAIAFFSSRPSDKDAAAAWYEAHPEAERRIEELAA